MEINKDENELKEEKDNIEGGEIKKEKEENKEEGEIKKEEEEKENTKEEEIKKKEDHKKDDENNKKEEESRKEENNKKDDENNRKEEENIKNDENKKEEENEKDNESKKEEENINDNENKKEENNKNGEDNKKDNENTKDSEIKKEEENKTDDENKKSDEIKKEEENKKDNENKEEENKKDNEKNKGNVEIKKDVEDKKEEENINNDENKKEEENKKDNEIRKDVENKKGDEIKNEEKKEEENKKDDENKIEEEFQKEEEENEKKEKEFEVKVIGDDYEKKSIIENDHSKIEKIIMENIIVSEYIGNISNFEKLKTLKVKNTKMLDDQFLKSMPNLTELCVKSIPTLKIDFLDFLPSKIQKLYLEKNNFINQEFKNIFNCYISKDGIAQNLQCLSFAGNNLTRIDLSSPKTKLENLIELDFRKNKICKIFINNESFPKLKFVNCCKNCLNRSFLNHLKNVISLESVNGYLLEPELCEPYYKKLKETLMNEDKVLFKMKYLNISHMPRVQSLEYFNSFKMVKNVTKYLEKLDLSYNRLNNETFFKFINDNQKFENLRTLNLNANDINDNFFEQKNFQDVFCNLEHLYLNSNKIGDINISIEYNDDIPIDDKYQNNKDKQIIYKLRAIYNFIEKNKHLTKLTITKNPISEFYSVVQESKNNADKSEKYIKKDNSGMIIINCLFSLCIKIRDELLTQNDGRDTFNLRFDCRSNVNKNSSNYPYSDKPFIYKSK